MKMSDLEKSHPPMPTSDFFSIEKGGEGRCRLVSELYPLVLAPFKESPSRTVYLCRVIDRKDGKMKLYKMGAQVYGQMLSYAKDADYGYEDVPNYDIKIQSISTGALPQNVKYNVVAGIPGKLELTAEEREQIAKEKDVAEICEKFQQKEKDKLAGMGNVTADQAEVDRIHAEKEEGDPGYVNPNDIPF